VEIKIGHDSDTHPLKKGKVLYLCGIKIPYDKGLEGHSDADVVLHSVAGSIIGALGLGDLGTLFKDDNPDYKDIRSDYFIYKVNDLMKLYGYKINNIDITIYIEKPKINEYIINMKDHLANLLNISNDKINIKATHLEGLGFIGRGEGVTADSVVLLIK
jgi:2-C-methyl-D-erythritol 2,4-cyclodiphosphate synthase